VFWYVVIVMSISNEETEAALRLMEK